MPATDAIAGDSMYRCPQCKTQCAPPSSFFLTHIVLGPERVITVMSILYVLSTLCTRPHNKKCYNPIGV